VVADVLGLGVEVSFSLSSDRRTLAQKTEKPWDVAIPRLFHFRSSATRDVSRIRF
jgi:hypothetical protein